MKTVWRKSTRCAADSPQCVEVNYPRGGNGVDDVSHDQVFVRDSKNSYGEVLNFPVGSFAQLVNLP